MIILSYSTIALFMMGTFCEHWFLNKDTNHKLLYVCVFHTLRLGTNNTNFINKQINIGNIYHYLSYMNKTKPVTKIEDRGRLSLFLVDSIYNGQTHSTKKCIISDGVMLIRIVLE